MNTTENDGNDNGNQFNGTELVTTEKKRIATPGDVLRSRAIEPDAVYEAILKIRDDRQNLIETDVSLLFYGANNAIVRRWREIINGVKGKSGDQAAGYEYLGRMCFARFKPGTIDLSDAIYERDKYDSDKQWLLNHEIGKEMLQWIGPVIMNVIAPDVEVNETKN